MAGELLLLSPWVPSEATLTRRASPVSRSWTKTSVAALVSPATRLDANEEKAMRRPVALGAGSELNGFACVPPEATLTRSVVPLSRSCTKTSIWPLVSPATRSDAEEVKATERPSALTVGSPLSPSP